MIRTLSLILAVYLGVAKPVVAGIVVLSGDTNFANFIDGSYGWPITPGNSTFLRNLLGNGTRVFVHNEGSDNFQTGVHEATVISNFYNSIGGVRSTLDLSADAITIERLAEIDLYIEVLPRNSYSSTELVAVNHFLEGSGTIFFIGDIQETLSEPNAFINESLSAIGSSMRLGSDTIFAIIDGHGWNITSNVADAPFTTAVSSFGYSATNTVSGGNSLLQTLDSRTLMAYEMIGATPVPEPASFLMLVSGVVVCFSTRRRQR